MELELPDMNLSNENYIYCLQETAYHLEVLTLKWVIVKDHLYFSSKLVLLQAILLKPSFKNVTTKHYHAPFYQIIER